jgi:hypothetical protein
MTTKGTKKREELPICPYCRIPVKTKQGSFPFCSNCQITWECGDNELPTEFYFPGEDREKAQ